MTQRLIAALPREHKLESTQINSLTSKVNRFFDRLKPSKSVSLVEPTDDEFWKALRLVEEHEESRDFHAKLREAGVSPATYGRILKHRVKTKKFLARLRAGHAAKKKLRAYFFYWLRKEFEEIQRLFRIVIFHANRLLD